MSETPSQHKLLDFVNKDTSYEEFKSKVDELVTGRKNLSLDALSEGLLFLAPFAPSPATFDMAAIKAIAMLEDDEAAELVNTARSLGILIDSTVADGRYEISQQAVETLGSILDSVEE